MGKIHYLKGIRIMESLISHVWDKEYIFNINAANFVSFKWEEYFVHFPLQKKWMQNFHFNLLKRR